MEGSTMMFSGDEEFGGAVERAEPCELGHFDCSTRLGGWCSAELHASVFSHAKAKGLSDDDAVEEADETVERRTRKSIVVVSTRVRS